jgi:hypothetical protein
MKRIIILCAALVMTASVFAQSPEKMSYQAVIRNSNNDLVKNAKIGMQISIIQGSAGANGSTVYVETQAPTSNTNGLVSLEIGAGKTASGKFSDINWSAGPFFIKTESDPMGGTNYSITGTSQLLSVPYALHAKTAETLQSKTYKIGYWPELGGYVFFVTPDGKHGLVAETQDQSASSSWYNAQDVISDPTNHTKDGKNFTDWRLPTKYELNLMSTNVFLMDGFPSLGSYWSSTEVDNLIASCYFFSIKFSGPENNDKSVGNYVRSVRDF